MVAAHALALCLLYHLNYRNTARHDSAANPYKAGGANVWASSVLVFKLLKFWAKKRQQVELMYQFRLKNGTEHKALVTARFRRLDET